MVRIYFQTVMLLTAMLFAWSFALPVPMAGAAETIALRGGQHATYSRLVFEAPHIGRYSVKQSTPEQIILTFNQNATLDRHAFNPATLNYINAVTQTASDPLTVDITIGQGRSYKYFKIKNKIILDVIKAKSEKPARPSKPKTHTNRTVKPAHKVPAPPVEQHPIIHNTKPDQDKETDHKTPHKEAPHQEEKPSKPSGTKPATVKSAITQLDQKSDKPNLVSLSSISPTHMAIFELDDKIWLVNAREDFLISPQVTGKQREVMKPIDLIPHQEAKIFTLNSLKNAELMTQGGGLVWRLLVGKNLGISNPIRPKRLGGADPLTRDGKIIWPFKDIGEIIDVKDPNSGVTIKAVTVGVSEDYAGEALDFVDFKTLRSPLGLTIWPKTDDLVIEKTADGLAVYRPQGLALTPQSAIDLARATSKRIKQALGGGNTPKVKQIYDFANWQLGGIGAIPDNKALILSKLSGLDDSKRAEGLLNLAKMYISNGMGAEALGLLDIAQSVLPDMQTNAEYKAIKGVALALTNRYEEAFNLLSDSLIKNKPEILNWRSYALANLQDWQQASDLLPANFDTIAAYPSEIAIPLTLTLTEIALRAGDLDRSSSLFALAQNHEKYMRAPQKATLNYLKGEAARQDGNIDDAIAYWKQLAKGNDDLYRVKAGLALTRLEREEKDLPLSTAVDRLERLRYAWRGDDLEAQVNYWLGRIYFDYGQYVKGLNIMRDSASYATGPKVGKRITAEMAEEFRALFMSNRLDDFPAPDAVALYERFAELNPGDKTGDIIAQKLADRLVQANLYDKAVELLAYQLNNRLKGEEAFNVAKRLAVIHLFNGAPEQAVSVLKNADTLRQKIPALSADEAITEELTLLKARALADNNVPEQALALLRSIPTSPQNSRLYADIAWDHNFWDDAAIALQNVMADEGIAPDRALTKEQADLVLQRAVALNLAGDRIRLANMREQYSETMNKTNKNRPFEVITRPRQSTQLADRETLLSIVSEVDLFSNVLNDIAGGNGTAPEKPTPPPQPAKESNQSSEASTR